MTDTGRSKLSSFGLAVGAAALLITITNFWIAASAPPASIEDRIADKAVAIRDTTIQRLTGRSSSPDPQEPSIDTSRVVAVSASALGGLALVLAVVGLVRGEPRRACAGAAALGASALVFPFVMGAIGAAVLIATLVALLALFFG